jgi:acetyl-CoA carboxylase carboxyltransferase component
VHASISGTIDFKEKDDPSCNADSGTGGGELPPAPFDRREMSDLSGFGGYQPMFGAGPQDEYDMQIIACIVDGSEFTEYKAEYGQTPHGVCGGFAVGL